MLRNVLRLSALNTKNIFDSSICSYRSSLHLHQLLVACTPKSGSTYLSTKFENLKSWRRGSFVPAGGRRIQELEGNSIRTSLLNPNCIVSQNHTRYSEHSAYLINRFSIKVVFLVRNILDCAASVNDHWTNESVGGPMMYLNYDYLRDIDRDPNCSRLQLIASAVIPFYVQFFLSWQNHCNMLSTNYVWRTYESIFNEKSTPSLELSSILSELQIPFCQKELNSSVLSSDKTRFNKGKIGRGYELFKQDTKAYDSIQRLLGCYPSVDFSMIFTPLTTTI